MVVIEKSWYEVLKSTFESDYFKNIVSFVKEEYSKNTIYPPRYCIFRAFDLCPFDKIKVVILGQDPYPGVGQANGLCFSVTKGMSIPKSLRNIFAEVKSNIGEVDEKDGDLTRWAQQGVFLLNTVLTVRANEAGSHFNHGWEIFTDTVIKTIAKNKKNIVYMLWGNKAREKTSLVDHNNNLILTSAHPSPLSAYNGFFGNKHFLKANEYLISKKLKAINWK